MPSQGNEGKAGEKYDRGTHPKFSGVTKGSRRVNKVGTVGKEPTKQGPTVRKGKKNSPGG